MMLSLLGNHFESFVFYNCLEYGISSFMKYNDITNDKLSMNFTSMTHAVGSVIYNGLHMYFPAAKLYKDSISWSTGYFLYDIYYMARWQKMSILRAAYYYHHISAMYIIHYPPKIYLGDKILFWGELSNIPSYMVYYYMKTQPSSTKLKWWKFIQKCMYCGIRLPIMTYMLVDILKNRKPSTSLHPILSVVPVYFMGLIWSYKLLCS